MNKKNMLFNICIYMFMSLIISIFIQVIILPINTTNGYYNSKFDSIINKMEPINYDVEEKKFIAQNNDPQLVFNNINSLISCVEVEFSEPVKEEIRIQIYFAKNGEGLSEKNSKSYNVRKLKRKIFIELPYNDYSMLRVDIGSNVGENFELEEIKICSDKINFIDKIIYKINSFNTVFFTCIVYILLNIIIKYKDKIFKKENNILEIIFIVFCFSMFTLWAIVQPFNSVPDELMRYDLIKYLFNYNKLPHGGDPLILNRTWGFSYAFLPYLSGIFSAILMKIISIFTTNEQSLILAARMAVVFIGTITVYYLIKISNQWFKGVYKWLFIVLTSCIPQFVFLSSYMNNDMIALLSVTMMIYYWKYGHDNKWNMKSNVGLAISVSISLLSYYNAYPFVLFSIIFFIWSSIYNKLDKAEILKKFISVSIIVFILCGWWFIRNFIIYNGDFLALSTMDNYSNLYAIEEIKPINRATPFKQGRSILFMLFNMGWFKITYKSFIGVFGGMNIPIYNWIYCFYSIIIITGIIAFIVKVLNLKKRHSEYNFYYLCMFLASILVILLSIYRSYKTDFQPQGRYVIEVLITLMMFVTIGIKYLFNFIEKRLSINLNRIILAISILCVIISVICFTRIIMPIYI